VALTHGVNANLVAAGYMSRASCRFISIPPKSHRETFFWNCIVVVDHAAGSSGWHRLAASAGDVDVR
jgi:hypothetical protein